MFHCFECLGKTFLSSYQKKQFSLISVTVWDWDKIELGEFFPLFQDNYPLF